VAAFQPFLPGRFSTSGDKHVELRGETQAGYKVETRKAFVASAELTLSNRGLGTELRLNCAEAVIEGTGEVHSLRYGLTNLCLDGNEGYREELPDGGLQMGRQSRFNLDGCEILVRSVPDSKEILEEVKATRGVGITAEATVATGLEWERVDELIHQLCSLLSLGLGRGIAWVYREALDSSGGVVAALHGDAITKPWSGHELVPSGCIETLVGATYPHFRAGYERWGLRNAILGYNDALLEGDYLEFRALKMAVVMEYLMSRYRPGRRLFRETAEGMCAALGVPLGTSELELLREIRNSLVHEATFLKTPAAPSVYEQYLLLATAIGAVLLAVIRYDGDWYDWRGASDGNGPRRVVFRLATGGSA
jgi:hypothetical protein